MAQEIADSTLLDTWASGGNIVEPDISKIIEGWQLGEQPPHEYMNWLQNTFGSKLNHILKNGVASWNIETEYLTGATIQHNGSIWICQETNVNSEPTELNNNWDKIPSIENLALTVDTIDDFPDGATTGDTCIVKDLDRGGIFIYDSTKVSEDNQGTNFNGWIRQYSGAVNVKWFGYTAINLYVSATGNDSNNGFTASTPFLTIQKAIDRFKEFDTTNLKTHTIHIASGTYTEGGVLSSHSFYGELVINGAGKTSTILDGTSASTLMGLNFNNCGNVRVKNLTVQNFSGDGSGIMFQNGTRGVIDTCDCINNAEANFNCSSESVIYMIGECKSIGSKQGLRIYGLSRGSIGDGTNAITIDAAGDGIVVRDGSRAVYENGLVVQNCLFNGVVVQKHSYVELRTCTIQDNVIGIAVANNSIIDTQTGFRTLTRNTTDYKIVQNSVDRSYYSPNQVAAQIWKPDGIGSGLYYSTLYDLIVDRNGQSGLQFLTNGNAVNIDFDKKARISVLPTTYLRFTVNSENAYQMNTAYFIPFTDNTKDLGQPSLRWKTIYAGTGAINTSDDREKTYLNITDIEKQVALELKANMKKFKFNDAIEIKGEKARIHFGASAQTVKSIFEKYGLNGFDYAILCYDKWEEQEEVKDEDGNIIESYRPAGDRYGIRYEELLCFIISAM